MHLPASACEPPLTSFSCSFHNIPRSTTVSGYSNKPKMATTTPAQSPVAVKSSARAGLLNIHPSSIKQRGTPQKPRRTMSRSQPEVSRLKVVIRRLPADVTEADVFASLGEGWKAGEGRVDWVSFRAGKVLEYPKAQIKAARVYLHLISVDHLKALAERVAEVRFTSSSSVSSSGRSRASTDCAFGPPMVQYAPYQRVSSAKIRHDSSQGTIDTDPEFMAFLEQLTQPVPARSSSAAEEVVISKPKTTPLIEYLKDKKAGKIKDTGAVTSPQIATAAPAHPTPGSPSPKGKAADVTGRNPSSPAAISRSPIKTPARIAQQPPASPILTSRKPIHPSSSPLPARGPRAASNSPRVPHATPAGNTNTSARPVTPTGNIIPAPNLLSLPSPTASTPPTAQPASTPSTPPTTSPQRPPPTGPAVRGTGRGRGMVSSRILRDLGIGPPAVGRTSRAARGGLAASSPLAPAGSRQASQRPVSSSGGGAGTLGAGAGAEGAGTAVAGAVAGAVAAPGGGGGGGGGAIVSPRPVSRSGAAPQTPSAPGSAPPSKPPPTPVTPISNRKAFLKHVTPSHGITHSTLLAALTSDFGPVAVLDCDFRKGNAVVIFEEGAALLKALAARNLAVGNGGRVGVVEFREGGPAGAVLPGQVQVQVQQGGGGRGGAGRGGRGRGGGGSLGRGRGASTAGSAAVVAADGAQARKA